MKRQFAKAVSLMCDPANWIQQGDQDVSVGLQDANLAMDSIMVLQFNPLPPGRIDAYAGETVPDGWLLCDGGEYSQSDYPELFSAIGTVWGGTTETFLVPDLTNRVVVGSGGLFSFAETGGESAHTLTTTEMPSHSHTVPSFADTPFVFPGEDVFGASIIPIVSANTGSAGGDGSHNNLQPYAAMNYIIYAGR